MRNVLATIVVLAGGLWLGAMVITVISLSVFFMTDRGLAVQFGPKIIHIFEMYQALVGGVTLVAMVGWRMYYCVPLKRWMTRLLIVAALAATFSTAVVTPRIDALWNAGESRSPEFWKWHGISQTVYLTEFLCLTAAMLLAPWAIRSDARHETLQATGAA